MIFQVSEHCKHGNANTKSCLSHYLVGSLERMSAIFGAYATIISQRVMGVS